jgi:CheY-like chemotaxis protein
VSDTGIGFDTKFKDNLFKAFSQADGSTTRKYGGTGLGLTICRRLVDMMGGEIWAKSEPGKGSSFCFTINAVISRDRPDRDFTTYSSLKNKKILIVDDNPSTREIMKLYVSSFGFMVETADSAFSALDLYKKSKGGEQYDLIIMDIKMPGKDGVTACEEILNDAGSNAPAIIIMSASFRDDDIKRMQMANINSFIMKPIKKSSLFDVINEQFGYKPSRLKDFSSEVTKHDDFSDVSILLVEDNLINQIVASEILMAVNARVVKAGTGIEAIDVLKHKKVDAVLMDVQMPEMDGLEATRIIRNGLKMADLPIIAMTAHTMQGDREECIAAGMNDYLPKPIDSKELFRVLKKNIARLKDKQPSSADEITIHKIDKSIFPEILPGIDVESGLKRVNGNRKLLIRIIREFKRDHADATGQIKNALIKKDMELALRLSHTIKGVAANCSAMDLATSAQNLESGIKKKQNDKYKDLLNDFDVLLKQVLEAAAILEQRNDEEKIVEKSVDKNFSEANPLVSKLSGYLKQRNNVKTEACMEVIKQYLYNTKFHDEVINLEDKIGRMDYKSAHNVLSLLADKMEILIEEVDK